MTQEIEYHLLPLVVEPGELEKHLLGETLLIVDLCKPEVYAQAHIPGAIHLDYSQIIAKNGMTGGLLPAAAQLSAVFSAMGLTPEKHVVAYDDEGGGKACRLLWTLDVFGHRGFSLLNGGLASWHNEGHPTDNHAVQVTPSNYLVAEPRQGMANAEYILAHLQDADTRIFDARSEKEYLGLTNMAARNGHIPGAIHLEWTFAMDPNRNLRLRPQEELLGILESAGITPDKEIIVHCQTHHRSAHTYIMLKSLGFRNVKGYPGSWSDWGNRTDTPVETGRP